MSDEAHEILTLLDTAETYLKTQAALYLQFGSVLQVGLDARTRADLILATVGFDELTADVEEGTDELLRRATQTDEVARSEPIRTDPISAQVLDALEDDSVTVTDTKAGLAEEFPPGFEPEPDNEIPTTPVQKATAAVMEPISGGSGDEGIGDREETEDLLRESGTVGAAADGGSDPEESTDPGIRVADPGEDALVTIEDTSDPRSDLDDLSDLSLESDLGDLDDDLGTAEHEVVVRKDDKPTDDFDDDFEELGIEIDLDDDEAESNPIPDDEETFIADLADIEKMKAKMAGAKPKKAGTPKVAVASPRAGTPRVQAGANAKQGGVTAGLYGNPSVPTIRDRNDPKPAAAAVQIGDAQDKANNGSGTGSMLEEEEVLELGSSEDYGEEYDDDNEGGGLSLDVQEYEEEEFDELEIEEISDDDLELEELEPDDVALEPIDEGPSEAELEALIEKAEAAVEDGDMETGINYYSDVLDSDPENVDAHVARGRLYLDYGDYSRAMSDFMYAETLQPENPEPQIAVGDLHFARKDYNRAIDYFNEALKMAPNHAMAFCRRGISHYYRKHYQQALDDLTRAQKIDDDIPNIRTYIAMAKKKTKR